MRGLEAHMGQENGRKGSNWGPKLFLATLVAALIFFWWLLLYSHGVVSHHGY
ncbi:MAG: hypothetical protein R8K46_10315 [Mariprofundaceae bacterium]